MSTRGIRGPIFVLACLGALAVAAVATAHSTRPARATNALQVRYRAADQALAGRIVLRPSDLDRSISWGGGRTTPIQAQPRTCSGFQPQVADLVVTGDAASDYSEASGTMAIHNEVQVLKTAKMATLDWKTNVVAPAALDCLRSFLAKSLPGSDHLISFAPLSVPRVAPHTAAFRATIATDGATRNTILDVIFAGVGRTEITLETTASSGAGNWAVGAESALARALVSRASHA